MFTLFSGCYVGVPRGTPTWPLHTGLCKFVQNISKNIWGLGKRTRLKIREVSSLLRWFPQNIRAIMAKIKLPNKPHGMEIFWMQLRRTYQDLSSQADPVREHWTYQYFNKNRHFTLVKNTMTHALSILTRFDINFLKNAWEFNGGVT